MTAIGYFMEGSNVWVSDCTHLVTYVPLVMPPAFVKWKRFHSFCNQTQSCWEHIKQWHPSASMVWSHENLFQLPAQQFKMTQWQAWILVANVFLIRSLSLKYGMSWNTSLILSVPEMCIYTCYLAMFYIKMSLLFWILLSKVHQKQKEYQNI